MQVSEKLTLVCGYEDYRICNILMLMSKKRVKVIDRRVWELFLSFFWKFDVIIKSRFDTPALFTKKNRHTNQTEQRSGHIMKKNIYFSVNKIQGCMSPLSVRITKMVRSKGVTMSLVTPFQTHA
jgi:hypothetical protein